MTHDRGFNDHIDLWDVQTGKLLHSFPGIDPSSIALGSNGMIASGQAYTDLNVLVYQF